MSNLVTRLLAHFTSTDVLWVIFWSGALTIWTAYVGCVGVRELRSSWECSRFSAWFAIRGTVLFVFILSSVAALAVMLAVAFVPVELSSLELMKAEMTLIGSLAPILMVSSCLALWVFTDALLGSANALTRRISRRLGFGIAGDKVVQQD